MAQEDFASTGNQFGNQDLGGFYADGGDPPVGKVSVVGERGPELFVPKSAGTIVPAEISRRLLGQAGASPAPPQPQTVLNQNLVINVDSRADRNEVRREIQAAVEQGNVKLVDRLSRAGRI